MMIAMEASRYSHKYCHVAFVDAPCGMYPKVRAIAIMIITMERQRKTDKPSLFPDFIRLLRRAIIGMEMAEKYFLVENHHSVGDVNIYS